MAAWQVHQSTMSHGCPHVRADGTQQQQHPAPTATRSHSRSVGSPTRHPRACATHSACHIATSLHRYSGVHRTMRSRRRRLGCNDCAQRLAKDACVDSPNVTRALSIEPPGRLAMQLIQREAPGPTLCGAPCDARQCYRPCRALAYDARGRARPLTLSRSAHPLPLNTSAR